MVRDVHYPLVFFLFLTPLQMIDEDSFAVSGTRVVMAGGAGRCGREADFFVA
jgi:hypothetical protein